MQERIVSALKRYVVPEGAVPRRIPLGLARGVRLEVNFHGQTRLYLGLYETELNPHLARICTPGVTTFDVGGQYGYDALLIANLTAARVISLECDPAFFESMRRNFALNPSLDPLVEARHAFVGDPAKGDVSLDQLAQDSFEPDFVKIDVEGGEADVLQGATALLSGGRPDLLIEVHSQALEEECGEILVETGYRPLVVSQRRFLREYRPAEHNRWLIAEGRRVSRAS